VSSQVDLKREEKKSDASRGVKWLTGSQEGLQDVLSTEGLVRYKKDFKGREAL